MLRYVFRRLLTAIPTLFVIVTIAFFLIRVAPGGPFNQERGLNPVIKANLDRQFGLDQPLWMQYLRYLGNLLRGDFGPSYNLPDFTVAELFKVGLPVSIQVGASALILALLIGGTLGIIAALRQNKGADYAVIATATAGSTIPTFVIAPLYQLLFATTLALVPVAGWAGGAFANKIGPIVTLALPQIAIVARLCARIISAPPARSAFPIGASSSSMPCVGLCCLSSPIRVRRRPPSLPARSSSRRFSPYRVSGAISSKRP
jgi:oligopeptide transport system permease protein